MTVIKQDDLIQSVADALQFISYYHPVDFIQAMHEAYLREESPAARDSMAQILINSRMCATGHRPICQDTGIVTVFVRVGMDVRWTGTSPVLWSNARRWASASPWTTGCAAPCGRWQVTYSSIAQPASEAGSTPPWSRPSCASTTRESTETARSGPCS